MAEVAIQGERGSFSHAAVRQVFGEDAAIVACPSFEELFTRVEEGIAGHGVVPVENTLAGSVTESLDLLTARTLLVTGETTVRVELCVVGTGHGSLEDAERAGSHPVALRQCRTFFRSHPRIEPVVAYDTAGSVRDLLSGTAPYDLAIGSALAAELYGGEILLRGVEDDRANFTRFLVVAARTAPPASGRGREDGLAAPARGSLLKRRGPVRAALAFVVPHRPGSLHRALGALADEGLDLTRLESRPIPGRPWEYRFYADAVAGDLDGMERGLERLEGVAAEVRVFGRWAADTESAASPTPPARSS